MKNILFILLTVTVFMTSCGNIEDTDGKIGNESKETENTENIKDCFLRVDLETRNYDHVEQIENALRTEGFHVVRK